MSKRLWFQARGVWERKIQPLRAQGFIAIPPGHPELTAQAAGDGLSVIARRNETYGLIEAFIPGDEGYAGAVWAAQRDPGRHSVYVSPRSAFYAEAKRLDAERRRQRAAQQAAEAAEKARLRAEAEGFVRELLQLLPGWELRALQFPDSPYGTRVWLRAPDGRQGIAEIRPLPAPGEVAERLLAAYATSAPTLYG